MEEKMNLDAAARFGRRKAKEDYGQPPAPEASHPPSEFALLRSQMDRTRLGIGVVLSLLMPGMGMVFAQEYGAGIGYVAAYGALIGLGTVFTPWLWLGAALVWLVNIVHTASVLESES